MLKLAGLAILAAAFGLAGIVKSEELKYRIRLLEDIQNMILQLKSQMNYFREPLQILLAKLAKTADSRAFMLLDACSCELHKKNDLISQIWAENTIHIYKGTPLTQEDMEIIRQIGTYLGQTDVAGHQMQFEYTEERLRRQIQQARDIYALKGPLYRKIGFLGGAAAALILL